MITIEIYSESIENALTELKRRLRVQNEGLTRCTLRSVEIDPKNNSCRMLYIFDCSRMS